MPVVDFRKNAEDNIVAAFYKGNEVKLIYHENKKIFESKRLYTTFTANNGSLYIYNLDSTYGNITEIYIDGVLQKETSISLDITKPTSIKLKGHFTVQDSTCDMYDFFIADGLEWVVSGYNTMFQRCTGITDLDLTYFNTSTVGTNMQNLFAGCTNLKTVNINNFDMVRVTGINSLFNGCTSLENINISGWKNTNKITTATSMFRDCISLKEVSLPQLPSLTNMQGMFNGCTGLKKIDMSGINSSNLQTVAIALFKVPSDCEVIVNSGFNSRFTPAQLGWDGTFTIR